jgi:hypothetical protein
MVRSARTSTPDDAAHAGEHVIGADLELERADGFWE